MNNSEFHQLVDALWDKIEQIIEDDLESDIDCERIGAVFNLYCPKGQIVINKQEPLHEIWLASKLGGFHFHYDNHTWVNHQGVLFLEALEAACVAYGETIRFQFSKK